MLRQPRSLAAVGLVWLLAGCATTNIPAITADPAPADPLTSIGRMPPYAESVLVSKGERQLHLLHDGKPFHTYRIALGFAPEGHKEREGDGRTPQGRYVIDWRNANSQFTKALNISYPNAEDRKRARAKGWKPGGAIMIHGLPRNASELQKAIAHDDWTRGCIALANDDMSDLWRRVRNGTPIEIRP